jgi:hypothetical protein
MPLIYSFGSFEILPENAFGTEFIPIPVSSDSSDDSDTDCSVEDAKRLRLELRQKKRECRALYADMYLVESYAHVERERRMALEVHLGCKFFLLSPYQSPCLTIKSCSLLPFKHVDTTERLNCLQEAANSLVRIVDRQGSPSPPHLHAAIDLMKKALKKKEKDAAKKK